MYLIMLSFKLIKPNHSEKSVHNSKKKIVRAKSVWILLI